MRSLFCVCTVVWVLGALGGRAQAPISPQSVFEPAAAEVVAPLAASSKASPAELQITEEKSNYTRTGPYTEIVDLARALEKRSKYAKLLPVGRSAEGREIWVLAISKDRAFTPEAARKTGKPVVFVQSGIHAGEIAGKSAMWMLVRDMLVAGRYPEVLDKVILLNMLVFNVDGHENTSPYHRMNQNGPEATGFRGTAQRVNLNRDYMKADSPEMQAWLRFYSAWMPHLLIDHHVTDGMDFQYDLTIDMPVNEDVALPLQRWTKESFLPALYRGMEGDGHVMGPYGYFDAMQPERGFRTQIFSPRFSQAYAAVRNRAGLLIETHSLKRFRTRVWAHYDVTLHALRTVAANPEGITGAVALAEKAMTGLGGSDAVLYLEGEHTENAKPYTFRGVTPKSTAAQLAGGEIVTYALPAKDYATRIFDELRAKVSATLPEAYLVPAAWRDVHEKLRLHGVRTQTLSAPAKYRCQSYQLTEPQFARQPFEGRVMVDFKAQASTVGDCTAPAGTVVVPMNQPDARVAANLLEPMAPDSLAKWGFFHALFERKEYFSNYVMEPYAQKMLEANSSLRAEFEKRVAEDAAFARNQRARLAWLYERSPYAESGYGRYPILRAWSAAGTR